MGGRVGVGCWGGWNQKGGQACCTFLANREKPCNKCYKGTYHAATDYLWHYDPWMTTIRILSPSPSNSCTEAKHLIPYPNRCLSPPTECGQSSFWGSLLQCHPAISTLEHRGQQLISKADPNMLLVGCVLSEPCLLAYTGWWPSHALAVIVLLDMVPKCKQQGCHLLSSKHSWFLGEQWASDPAMLIGIGC